VSGVFVEPPSDPLPQVDTVAQAPRFLRRLMRRPLAIVCAVYLLLVIGTAVIAPIVLPDVANQGIGELLHFHEGPSATHLLGTDTVGRDVLMRLLVGTRLTMIAVAEALLFAAGIGIPLGLAAGYLGGTFDRCVTWVTNLTFSFPHLIIILVVASIFQQNLFAMMVALGTLAAPGTARIIRGATLPVREELYIDAARVSGLSRPYIIGHHILPRIAGVVIVQLSLFAAGAVGITAGLGFLGVTNPNDPSWGGMLHDGFTIMQLDPWLLWPPGIAIGLTVLAFTLLGDSVRDTTAEGWSSSPQTSRRRRRHLEGSTAVEPTANVLEVRNLAVAFFYGTNRVPVLKDVSFVIAPGEAVGLVGESGCGKTMTAMAVLGLLPGAAQIEAGSIRLEGRNICNLPDRDLARVRGKEIALVSQEPTVSLTPTFRVGWQIAEAVRRHHKISRRAARRRALELLQQVRLPEPDIVYRRYPHELSGGMAQRVAIARALAGDPKLLIADEPTTALDVTVQEEILNLLRELRSNRGMALLLITHNWGVVADTCDRAIVMYAGQIVEEADVVAMFRDPRHPYTEALLQSNPHNTSSADRLPAIPGAVPKPGAWPSGCHFHPRCVYATENCATDPIPLLTVSSTRESRCIHHDRVGSRAVNSSRLSHVAVTGTRSPSGRGNSE
jgi:peptide/nickel transport system permease protein